MRKFVALLVCGGLSAVGGWFASDAWERSYLPQAPPPPTAARIADGADATRAVDAAETATAVRFRESAQALGVDFAYRDGATGDYQIMETTGGGVAALDYDLDGTQDLFFTNGNELPLTAAADNATRLYRNRGAVGMRDVTAQAGAGAVLFGQGVTAGDVDADGFVDLLCNGYGKAVLLRNNGDGTFADVTEQAGIAMPRWGSTCVLADLDVDGVLDAYLACYAEVDAANPLHCGGARRAHCHPQQYVPQPDVLYRGTGDGAFADVSQSSGIADHVGRALGVIVADLTAAPGPELYLANDTTEAFLFQRTGSGTGPGLHYEEVASRLGLAKTGDGTMMAGMGVAAADVDGNGLLDVLVTNYYEQPNILFLGAGELGFEEATARQGLSLSTYDKLGWGAVFLDADLDRDWDLVVANGHVSDFVGKPYHMEAQFFENEDGRFADRSAGAGAYFRRPMPGRGAATVDLNDDGRADVAIVNIERPAALLVNETPPAGPWVGLDLVGRRSNRDGLNVRVVHRDGADERLYEVVPGAGYFSSSDHRLIVAGGDHGTLTVTWPSGAEQTLSGPEPGRYHVVVEPLPTGTE